MAFWYHTPLPIVWGPPPVFFYEFFDDDSLDVEAIYYCRRLWRREVEGRNLSQDQQLRILMRILDDRMGLEYSASRRRKLANRIMDMEDDPDTRRRLLSEETTEVTNITSHATQNQAQLPAPPAQRAIEYYQPALPPASTQQSQSSMYSQQYQNQQNNVPRQQMVPLQPSPQMPAMPAQQSQGNNTQQHHFQIRTTTETSSYTSPSFQMPPGNNAVPAQNFSQQQGYTHSPPPAQSHQLEMPQMSRLQVTDASHIPTPPAQFNQQATPMWQPQQHPTPSPMPRPACPPMPHGQYQPTAPPPAPVPTNNQRIPQHGQAQPSQAASQHGYPPSTAPPSYHSTPPPPRSPPAQGFVIPQMSTPPPLPGQAKAQGKKSCKKNSRQGNW